MDTAGLAESLLTLARNHHWTWSPSTRDLFGQLPGFSGGTHPVTVVSALNPSELAALAADTSFVEAVERCLAELNSVTSRTSRSPRIAYFSPEFGISELVPQYSGGLGVLAGDHLKAASDLGLELCAVGLFYREGFFRQVISAGRQVERYESHSPGDLGCVDTGVEVRVPFPGGDVSARVWELGVGAVRLFLLDSRVASNTPAARSITDRLYGGDRRHRLEQELLLGVGGARALNALGLAPRVHHLNEGHAGFLILELLDREIAAGATLDEARAAIRPGLVFTTHTPVPAGIDRFEPELVSAYLRAWADRWSLPLADLLALGADPDDDPPAFNMAALCLKSSGRANGVSRLHGEVSRRLFAHVPGGRAITSVTNGVHSRTWACPEIQRVFDQQVGPTWDAADPGVWERLAGLDDHTIRGIRARSRRALHDMLTARTGTGLHPRALTIGFARRFATYKRADLVLDSPEVLASLLADDEHPVHFIFSGKAHPADEGGKALLAEIVAFSRSPRSRGRFTFIPDYDMGVARALVSGCDLWLNNPIRPREASGTSGEKVVLNGGLNLSIADGWWAEMADDRYGWTIPSSDSDDPAVRDREESAALLTLLTESILPLYHGPEGPLSADWVARIRQSWATLGPNVSASRMVSDYRDRLYLPVGPGAERR